MSQGLFLAGTDTGVGKTTIAVGLCAAWAARGHRVAAMKPCETGGGDDAARLLQATGRALDLAQVNPYRFALAAAPEVAARSENARIELSRIEAAYRALDLDADFTLVEGAGGLLVPLAGGLTIADLIQRLDLPLLLVARTCLGTINHTLLSAEIARRRGLRLLGVVFSRVQRSIGPEERETVSTIVRHGELRSFGVLPFLSAAGRASAAKLGAAVETHLQIDRLLDTVARATSR